MVKPGPFRMLLALLCACVGLSAASGVVLAIANRPAAAWFTAGFEAVIVVSSVFGIRTALGWAREGQAVTYLCVAGCFGVGSLLGFLGAGRHLFGISLVGVLIPRIAAGAVLAGASAVEVLGKSPRRALPLLARGVVMGLPAMAVVAAAWYGYGSGRVASWPPLVLASLAFFGFLAMVALCAASAHMIIRAFIVAQETEPHGPDPR